MSRSGTTPARVGALGADGPDQRLQVGPPVGRVGVGPAATIDADDAFRPERLDGPARLDQLDQGQPVALGDLHGPQGLPEPERVGGPAAHGRVAGRDHALDPGDRADPGDAADPHREVGPPGGQRGQLQEGPVPVHQQLDPLPGQQLAPGPVTLHVLGAAAGPGLGQQPVQLLHQLQVGGPVGPVGVRGRVEPAPEHAHPQPPFGHIASALCVRAVIDQTLPG
jgi:hypothetical protein